MTYIVRRTIYVVQYPGYVPRNNGANTSTTLRTFSSGTLFLVPRLFQLIRTTFDLYGANYALPGDKRQFRGVTQYS